MQYTIRLVKFDETPVMGKKVRIIVANKEFETKSALQTFTKAILNSYPLYHHLSQDDQFFISELLKRHPEHDKKVGSGIQSIQIKPDGHWGTTRCFYIIRTDGSETDFSYGHCINNDTSREPLKMFKSAARSSIENQPLD